VLSSPLHLEQQVYISLGPVFLLPVMLAPQVMSRSGDECVVALTDQWYLGPTYSIVTLFSAAGDELQW
jgi:hypothetical protein